MDKGRVNYIGHLFQGIVNIKGTNTCLLIHRKKLPQGAKVTYFCIVCNILPHKKAMHWVKITVGGEKLTFEIPVSTYKSNVTTSKLHCSSFHLTSDSRYLVVYIKNFLQKKPMSKHDFYKISIRLIPQDIIYKCNLVGKSNWRFNIC